MRTTPALAGLLATLILPGAARAVTIGTIPVDPNQPVTGSFTADNAASTQSWRLDLEKGKLYALSGFSSDGATVTLKRAGGQTLALFNANTEDPGGVSFRAPYTGLYSVKVACGEGGSSCVTPSSYTLTAGRDCPGTIATPCTIAVGQTLHSLWLSYDYDTDAFRTRLVGGVSYAVALPVSPGGGTPDVEVDDDRGRTLVVESCCLFRFTAPASGTYYIAVSGGDGAEGSYDLSLSR